MKQLLLCLMFCCTLSVSAQRVNGSAKPYDYFCYVRVLGWDGEISYPGDRNWATLMDDDGKKLKFKNDADLLNYMSKRGWTYVDKKDDKYLMKIEVVNDEQVYNQLNLKLSKHITKKLKNGE